MIKHTDTKTIT